MAERSSILKLVIDTSSAPRARDDLRSAKEEAHDLGNEIDRVGDKSKRSGSELSEFGAKAGRIAGTLGAAAVAAAALAATLTFKQSITAAAEAEQALAQVRQGIESTGSAAKRSIEDIIELTTQLQKEGVFGDDQLQKAAANLLTFTGIAETAFDRTLKAATDISVRVGQDLNSTIIQLGKALNDPIANLGALSRTGIQFSESQKVLITNLAETNRLAEAQALILDELENQYGGSAKAARETFGGAVTAVKNAWGDLLEVLGGPAIENATDDFNHLADVLYDPETVRAIQTIAQALAGLFEVAVKGAADAVEAVSGFVNSLKEFAQTRGLIKVEVDPQDIASVEARIEEIFQRKSRINFELNSSLSPNSVQEIALRAELGELSKEARGLFDILDANAKGALDLAENIGEAAGAGNDLSSAIRPTADDLARAAKEAEKLAQKAREAQSEFLKGGFTDTINDTLDRFGDIDLSRLTPSASNALVANFEKSVDQLQGALEEIVPLLEPEDISKLRDVIEDGQKEFYDALVDGAEEGAQRLRDGISAGVGTLLDDLIFNGGRGFGDFFRGFGRDVVNDNFIDPISKAFAGDGDIIGNITKAFDDFGAKFQKIGQSIFGKNQFGSAAGSALGLASAGFGGFQLGTGISDLLGITGNKKSVAAGGAIGGAAGGAIALGASAGSVVPIVGTLVGAALGAILGGLLSKPSDNAAGGGVNFKTFSPENQFSKNNDPETIAARDALLSATSSLAETIAELTGASFAGSGISVQVGSRNGTRIISGAGGDVTTPVGDAQAALDEIFRQLIVSLRGGEKALVDYAKAAQAAGRDVDTVIDGLSALKSVFDLTTEPLSAVEQALKLIDDTINPVIADLESLGQSIAGISKVAQDAARSIGKAFIDDIQQQILDATNGTLGDYKRLIDQIKQQQKDAITLFERGAITQGELESVNYLGALQSKNFFESLSPEELASLGDFFGMLGDELGATAAALAKLELGITDFVDNVIETVDRLTQEAEDIQNAVDRALDTRDNILRRFSPLLPGEQLTDLRGQLGKILQDVQDPNASAEFITDQINLASDLAKQFVDLSASVFGPTAQFGQDRDFATAILEDIAAAGQDSVDERLSLIEAANKEVAILQEIRDTIASPDPSLDFIQQIIDDNSVTNSILRDLLTQYLAAATQQAITLNPSGLQTAADQFLAAQGFTQQPANSNQSAALVDQIIRSNQNITAQNQQIISGLNQLITLADNNNIDQRDLIDLQRAILNR